MLEMIADEESSHLVRLIKVEEDGSSSSNSNRKEHVEVETPLLRSLSSITVAQVKFIQEVEEGTKPVLSSVRETELISDSNTENAATLSFHHNNNDDSNDKSMGNHNNNKDEDDTNSTTTTILDPYDAMADIAANSHLRARTKRRCHDMKDADDDTTATTTTTTINDDQAIIPQSHSCKSALTTPTIPSTTTMTTTMMSYQQQQQIIVTASMSNHYIPPRLHRRGGSFTTVSANTSNSKSNNKKFVVGGGGGEANKVSHSNSNINNNDNKNRQQVSIHLLQSVGLECSDAGVLRLDQFDDHDDDDDDDNIININGGNHDKIKTTGDRDNTTTNTNKATFKRSGVPMWTLEQHKEFAVAIFESGLKNCSPSIIMENMRKQPKYITRERTKSHLQKYRQTKERSKIQFLKDYDAFFKSTEQAKIDLACKSSPSPSPLSSSDHYRDHHESKENQSNINKMNTKEPIPKAVLTAALDGKKPSKLLGGKVAALLSYSVLNKFSTEYGPDQLQYKAAKIQEFPIMTEEEKRTSVGASLLQIKSLLDNMTDALLKTRHGIKPMSRKKGIKDDDSVASSLLSSDNGYSDDDDNDDNGKEDGNDQDAGVGKGDNRLLLVAASNSKDQDSIVTADNRRSPFDTGMGVSSGHPLYQGPPPTTYSTSTFSGQAPPQAAYSHPPLSFYGGGPPPILAPVAPSGYNHTGYHHHPLHYTQDPRLNPYQQIPGSAYPGPPSQPNYYTSVASTTGYPAYYDGTNIEYSPHTAAAVAPTTTSSSGDPYSDQQQLHSSGLSTGNDGHHQQHLSVYRNEGQEHRQIYERAGKRSKHRQGRNNRREKSSSLSIETTPRLSSNINTDCDFMNRVAKVPSPVKHSRRSSSSPIQSRKHRKTKSSSPVLSASPSVVDNNQSGRFVGQTSSIKPKRTGKRSRSKQETEYQSQQLQQQQQQLDTSSSRGESTPVQLVSSQYDFGGCPTLPFSEAELSPFVASPYGMSPDHAAEVDRTRQQHNKKSQFWDGPTNFMDADFINNDQQQQNQGGVNFEHQQQQYQQPDNSFQPDQQQQRYDGVDGQHVDDNYRKGASFSNSPTLTESSGRYFFGE